MTTLASILAVAALKGTVLLLLLAAAVSTMQRTSAATRHLVWSLGLIGLLLLPVLSVAIPWRLAFLPGPPATAPMSAAESAAPPMRTGADRQQGRAPAEARGGLERSGVFFGGEGATDTGTATAPLPGLLEDRTPTEAGVSIAAVVAIAGRIWLAGAGLFLAWLLMGAIVVRLILRRGTPLRDYGWHRLLHDAQEHLGVEAPVRLVCSPALPMPVTAGILRPVIILPSGADEWSEERRWAVLLHELAHVRRRDLVSHLIARVACACYWFHPLVWFAAKRLRAESERACDDLVLTSGQPAAEYADHLLQIVRGAGYSRTPAVAVPMAQRSEFEGRLLAILEPGIKRHKLSLATGVAITLLIALTALPLAALTRAPGVSAAPPAVGTPIVVAPDTSSIAPEAAPAPDSIPLADGSGAPSVEEGDVPVTEALEPAAAPPEAVARRQQPAGTSDPVPVLIRALEDANEHVREAALRSLGELEDARALPALITVIDRYPAQRLPALKALSEYRDPRTTPVVVRLLRDADPRVRAEAVDILGNVQDTTAIAALSRALRTDTDPQVRRAAARALGDIDDPRAIPALAEALARDTSLEVRKSAAWALGEIEDPRGIEPLSAAVADADADLRRIAVRALADIEDRRATPVLIPLLKDSDPKVRAAAAAAMADIEDPAFVEPLGAALHDSDMTVRRQVARALGDIQDARAVPFLLPAAKDADVQVRKYVVWALGEIEDLRAVDVLTEALGDASPEVRAQAAESLGDLEHPNAAPGLRRALGDASPQVRRQAASALGDVKLSAAPAELLAALKDPDVEVRKRAANALGDIEDPASAPALAEAVRDQNRDVRLRALRALGELGTQTSINELVKAMDDPDPEVRTMAARLLGKKGSR